MSSNLNYTPTFMEKLLGRWYKWWHLFVFNIQRVKATFAGDLISQSSFIVNTILIILVWLQANPKIEIITYLLVGRMWKTLTDNFWYNKIGGDIIFGTMTSSLLKPHDYFWEQFIGSFGARSVRNLLSFFSMLLVLIGFTLFNVKFIISYNIFVICLILPIAFFINYSLCFLVGCIAFFIKDRRDFNSVTDSYNGFAILFVGSVLPLTQLPFKEIFYCMPFAWLLHHPMQIYLGKYDTNQTILVFVGGIIWCVVLYFLAKLVFKMGLKRNESVGL